MRATTRLRQLIADPKSLMVPGRHPTPLFDGNDREGFGGAVQMSGAHSASVSVTLAAE